MFENGLSSPDTPKVEKAEPKAIEVKVERVKVDGTSAVAEFVRTPGAPTGPFAPVARRLR